MLEFYNRLYGQMDGSSLREPRLFLRRKNDACLILRGPHASDWAYAIFRTPKWEGDARPHLIEAAGTGRDWPDAVVFEAARYAGKVKHDSMIFALYAAHPVCRRLAFRNAAAKTEYFRNGGAMVAVLDFAGLAQTMAPEWCRLVGGAGVPVPRDGLVVRFRDECYRWWPNRGDGRTERLTAAPRKVDMGFNDALARLVVGYGQPEDVMHSYGMRAKEMALPILRAIFPARHNAYCPLDHF